MNLFEKIKGNRELNLSLMRECDILFYEKIKEVAFQGHGEIYSIPCKAFAQDGSGGEFVFLNDGSIALIGSEGEVGRISESLEELLTFLIHAGSVFDFNCKQIYQNQNSLKEYCSKYISKIREDYHAENKDWDKLRSGIAKDLSLSFNPDKLAEFAMNFYKAAIREPIFSCRYVDGGDEYICDSILSDNMGLWTLS